MTTVQQLTTQLREREGRLRQREEELKLKDADISRLQREIQRLQVGIALNFASFNFCKCAHILRHKAISDTLQGSLLNVTQHSGAKQRPTVKVAKFKIYDVYQ